MPRPFLRPMADQELASPGPRHPRGIITAPARALPGGTPRDAWEGFHEHLRESTELRSQMKRLMDSMGAGAVLETATATIPAADAGLDAGAPGVWTRDRYRVPFASVAVINPPTTTASVYKAGSATAPLAGAPIVTLPVVLPAGLYTISGAVHYGGTVETTAIDNFQLQLGSKVLYPNLDSVDAANGAATPFRFLNVASDGVNAFSINAIVNASAGATYIASLQADPVGSSLIVTSGSPQTSAPGGGQGQIYVAPSSMVAMNLAGSQLTIYGTPGQLVSYSVMTRPIQPYASLI